MPGTPLCSTRPSAPAHPTKLDFELTNYRRPSQSCDHGRLYYCCCDGSDTGRPDGQVEKQPKRKRFPDVGVVRLVAILWCTLHICFLVYPAGAVSPAPDVPAIKKFEYGVPDKKVLDRLVNNSEYFYDKRLRPSSNGPTVINVSVILMSLASPDESSLKYEVEFLMHQHWFDARLRYDDAGTNTYLNGIYHAEHLWIPDTYFIKHGDFKHGLRPDNIALRIWPDGTVKYSIRRHLILSCEGDLTIFPFDDPKCFFSIESLSHEVDTLIYQWEEQSEAMKKSPAMHALNAYLIRNSTSTCGSRANWRGNYSCVKVTLVFTRDKSFYFSTVFIPGMLLVTSSFITFWLEWNAVPGRIMLGVTTMLNFFTTSNNFRSNLPVVSNLTAMNVWDGACMVFIYASLLEFVLVNYLGRKKPRPTRYQAVATAAAASTDLARKTIDREEANAQLSNSKKSGMGSSKNGSTGDITMAGTRCSLCPNSGPGGCAHTQQANAPSSPQEENELKNNGAPRSRSPSCQLFKLNFSDLSMPLRIAKSIDVVSRVMFPIAYGIFLICFFIKFKGVP